MFENIKNIFKSKNACKKIIVTFVLLAITRLLTTLPVPGINRELLSIWANSNEMKALGFMDMFSGNTMQNVSFGAIGITSYINASIIIQLLTVAIPYLNDLTKQGKDGTDKLKKITFYVSLGISTFQSIFFTIRFNKYGMLENGLGSAILIVVSLVMGSMFIYFISKIIDNRGVGNGVSFIIATNIASNLYMTFGTFYDVFIKNKPIANGIFAGVIALGIIGALMYFIILYTNGEKRLAVTYPGNNRYTNAEKTYLPIKPSMSGVMPAIMGATLFSILSAIPQIFKMGKVPTIIFNVFSTNKWFDFNGLNILYSVGAILYVLVIVGCAYLYSKITFNPQQVADNLRLSGGMVNGIRQDKMAKEIERQTNNALLIGGLGMAFIMLIPTIIAQITNIDSLSIGGTSLIILVSVSSELSKKIVADAKIESDSKMSFRGKGRKLNVKTY